MAAPWGMKSGVVGVFIVGLTVTSLASTGQAQELPDGAMEALCARWENTIPAAPCPYRQAVDAAEAAGVAQVAGAATLGATDVVTVIELASSQDDQLVAPTSLPSSDATGPLDDDWFIAASSGGAESDGEPLRTSVGDTRGGGGGGWPSVTGENFIGYQTCKARDAHNNFVRGINALYGAANRISDKWKFYLWHQNHVATPSHRHNDRLAGVGADIQADYRGEVDDLVDWDPQYVTSRDTGGYTFNVTVAKGPFGASFPWTIGRGGHVMGGEGNYAGNHHYNYWAAKKAEHRGQDTAGETIWGVRRGTRAVWDLRCGVLFWD